MNERTFKQQDHAASFNFQENTMNNDATFAGFGDMDDFDAGIDQYILSAPQGSPEDRQQQAAQAADGEFGEMLHDTGFFATRSVLENMAQTLIKEIGRAQFRADTVEHGDQIIFDTRDQRPAPDTTGQERRQLTEGQATFLDKLYEQIAGCTDMLKWVVNHYTAAVGDPKAQETLLAYAVTRTEAGRWERTTDARAAIAIQYERARDNERRKQQEQAAAAQGYDGAGHELLRDSNRRRADSVLDSL